MSNKYLERQELINQFSEAIGACIRTDSRGKIPGLHEAIAIVEAMAKKRRLKKEEVIRKNEKKFPYASIIYAFRQDKGMTGQGLADALGYHVNTITRWENAKGAPGKTALEYLRKTFPDFVEYEKASPYLSEEYKNAVK